MDTQRLILFMLFTFSSFFLIDAWQKDAHPPMTVPASSVPKGTPSATPVPSATQPSAAQPSAVAPSSSAPVTSGELQKGEQIRVQTDRFIAVIDTAGGDLRHLELLSQRDTLDKTKNFALLELQPARTYIAQAGLIGKDAQGKDLPNHRTLYTASEREVKLGDGEIGRAHV